MEEEYDILGILVLGLVTAFGGGVIRNVLIGVPVTTLWSQGLLIKLAILSVIVAFLLPLGWIRHWKRTEAFLMPSAYRLSPFKGRFMPRICIIRCQPSSLRQS